jgi:hypothetical protein
MARNKMIWKKKQEKKKKKKRYQRHGEISLIKFLVLSKNINKIIHKYYKKSITKLMVSHSRTLI